MKKKEIQEHIRKGMGYIPCVMLFDLYEDDDKIPQEFIEMLLKPRSSSFGEFMICSASLAEQLKKLKL